MKKITLILAVLFISITTFAQMPGGAQGNRQASSNAGHIFGKITSTDGKSINDGSVLLMQDKFDTATKKTKQFLYKSLITQANGDFSFEDLPVSSKYTLKISSTGFKAYDMPVSFFVKPVAGAAPGMPSFEKSPQALQDFYLQTMKNF